jgi:hypothetical protein
MADLPTDATGSDLSFDAPLPDTLIKLDACANNLAFCSGTCVETQTDDNNCGSCGNTCQPRRKSPVARHDRWLVRARRHRHRQHG